MKLKIRYAVFLLIIIALLALPTVALAAGLHDPTPTPVVTFDGLVESVTDTVATYQVIVFAAAAVGLIFWGLKRFLKAGR